ncbi:proteasome assembly chaperone family protein [archaeon]|nr:proteasome assembly chaperone family protein [archaeon]MBT6868921.1 proteasome assembly chaperone family protein [archaeon]MBT7192858.1 proteasome assembly chaperone family protein [archaeon]MBT7380824.1 proteasome assembly chaperone family protein [archaeon]MBT7507579.1 proteasome assembly chaperone family protein [archaeon]
MKLILKKKPKKVKIIEGFPGFGLIGTIATEFLMDHLEIEKIGLVEMDEIPAMVAIHQNELVEPISIHYNKKYNLVLVHAINIGKGQEWKLAEIIQELATKLEAKEIISLEGVGSPNPGESRVFYYTTKKNSSIKKLEKVAEPLKEGIIVGVTGALMSKDVKIPLMSLFAEAKSNLPDSNAAAEIIKALDAYTGLKIDPKPLFKQAKMFEEKLKGIVSKTKDAEEVQEHKHLSYVG